MRNRSAFTLVELLVVVAIIVALLAILLPSMGKAIYTANETVCASNMKQVYTAHMNDAADHFGAFASNSDGHMFYARYNQTNAAPSLYRLLVLDGKYFTTPDIMVYAASVGFYNSDFPGGRIRHIAAVIRKTEADIVCVQEDAGGNALLDALGAGWHRAGHIYSRFPLSPLKGEGRLTIARATLPGGGSLVIGDEHWSPGGYGPFAAREWLRTHTASADPAEMERIVLDGLSRAPIARDYDRTVRLLKPYVDAGEAVLVTGDFNEPSHLDWTQRYAEHGEDRWSKNPTDVPLRQAIAWPGSQRLAEAGFRDAYRVVWPDEVARPGTTWTPPYPPKTPGRVDFDDQVFDRIDRVYFAGDAIRVTDCRVVGESKRTSDVVYTPWPSDHRAVLAVIEVDAE